VYKRQQGSCKGIFPSDTNYFHAVQLGVVCGVEDIRYDDYFVACASGNARYDELVAIISSPDLRFSIPFGEEIRYTCVSGRDCQGNACLVDAPTLVAQTKLSNIVESSPECIQTNSPMTEGDPLIPTLEVPQGLFTTRFNALWELVKHNSWSSGEIDKSIVVVSCLGGTIDLVLPNEVVCTETDGSTLVCEDVAVTTRGPIDKIRTRGVTYVSSQFPSL